MKRSRILLAVTAALLPLLATCAGRLSPPTPATRAELAPTGTLRVALFLGNPILVSKDPSSHELRGMAIILGKALAERAGVPFTPIEYATIPKLIEDMKAGAWDIAFIAFDPARGAILDYTPAYMVVDNTYLVAPGFPIRTITDADQPGIRIAVARGAAPALFLERNLKNAQLVPAESESAAFELVKEGKAHAYAQNRYMLLGLAERLPGSRVLDDRFVAIQQAIALPKGRPAALAYVREFVEQAKASGAVLRAIETAGIRGVQVTPPASGQ